MRTTLLSEDLVPVRKAGKLFPGVPLSAPTCWRYALRGIRGVKLESVKIGQQRYTSKAAILRFIEATQTDDFDDVQAACEAEGI